LFTPGKWNAAHAVFPWVSLEPISEPTDDRREISTSKQLVVSS
jgi:hypothetical protein